MERDDGGRGVMEGEGGEGRWRERGREGMMEGEGRG